MIVTNQRLIDYEPFTDLLKYEGSDYHVGVVLNFKTKWAGTIEDIFDTEWIDCRVTDYDDEYLGRVFFVTEEKQREVSDFYPCGRKIGEDYDVNCNLCHHFWRDCGGC